MPQFGYVSLDEVLVPLHQAPSDLLENCRISAASLWDEPVWRFGRGTAGQKEVTLLWTFEMPDGQTIADPEWAHLLDLGRRLIWSLWAANRRGKPLKPRTLLEVFGNLRYLLRWMGREDYGSFAELDMAAAEEFRNAVADDKVTGEAEDEISADKVAAYLDVLCRIFEQAPELQACPPAVMPAHPFGGRSAYDIAKGLTSKTAGFIPPVPDQVYIPSMQEALRWLGAPARDIIRLAWLLQKENRARTTSSNSYTMYLNRVLATFDFDDDGKLEEAWHPRLDRPFRMARWSARSGSRTERVWTPIRRYRRLLANLRGACTIVVQGMLGLRISELAGLKSGQVDPITGWPACIEARPSLTGLNEIFYIKGRLFKTRDHWQEVEWVAGSRPAGTTILPPPVEALLVLHRLYEPWRAQMQTDDLILSFGSYSGLPGRNTTQSYLVSDVLREGQKEFIDEHVTLPPGFETWNVTTHQWRKSFALYVFRSDERLLPAISNHFKHMSLAMTEQGYLGSDPELLGVMNDVATREAARLLFEAVNGKSVSAGKMAERISDNAASIQRLIGPEGTDEERISRLADTLRDDDVRVWPAPWGKCLFRAETARCHHQARGEFDLSARRPHYVQRQPSVCCECSNLLVVSEAHAGFWQERHAENLRLYEENRDAGEHAAAAVAAERARTSASILRKMNIVAEIIADRKPSDAEVT